jgi:cytosine/adenosine deaminase-related metal-dependent hydrolase
VAQAACTGGPGDHFTRNLLHPGNVGNGQQSLRQLQQPSIAEFRQHPADVNGRKSSEIRDLPLQQGKRVGVIGASAALRHSLDEAQNQVHYALLCAASPGRRVHMHFLESRCQREWMDASYRAGVVNFLDGIGLLSPRLTVAHGVWLKPEEIEVLAAREVIVSLNTSSNLRLGSGIAPARDMLAKGIPLALGLDGLALDDDDDALREMRLADVLHRGPGFVSGIPSNALFAASMAIAPRAVTGARVHGELARGMAADIVTLDYGAMSRDVIEGVLDPSDLVLARGTARHVLSLMVAGREVVKDGAIVGIDVNAMAAEVAAQIAAQKKTILGRNRIVAHYQQALRTFYLEGQHMCGHVGAADTSVRD